MSTKTCKKIAHLTSVHPRRDTRIFHKECKSLAIEGYDVHLFVGDGQGDEVTEGIHVHDIGVQPRSRLTRIIRQPRKMLERVVTVHPDIVHFHDPELLPIGVKLAKMGKYVIYDAHEDVPKQILTKHWIPSVARSLFAKVVERYENWAVRRMSGVIGATPHIANRFQGKGSNAVAINNFPIVGEFAADDKSGERPKKVCYIGVISRIRGLIEVVRAMPLLPDVQLTICGDFSESALEEELRAEAGWSQVEYMGLVSRDEVKMVMSESRAGIVTFLPAPNHTEAQPNKMFEYMSAGLPVIASDFPLWRQIIDGADCGVCVDPESPQTIAAAIREIVDSPERGEAMGKAGRQAVLDKYNWPIESKKLIDFYNTLTYFRR